MDAAEHLKACRLDEALAKVEESARSRPGELSARVELVELLSILGEWERARIQLEALRRLSAEAAPLAAAIDVLLASERTRAEVIQGRAAPEIFGPAVEWVARLAEASRWIAEGDFARSAKLRDEAMESATPPVGRRGDGPAGWIADGDARFGPVLEAVVDGRYGWVPLASLKRLQIKPAKYLRNRVWADAVFDWADGRQTPACVPTRYPGTEQSADNTLRMAQRTEWLGQPGDCYIGRGQRVLFLGEEEVPILEAETIEINSA